MSYETKLRDLGYTIEPMHPVAAFMLTAKPDHDRCHRRG
jgi:hypothetical protein